MNDAPRPSDHKVGRPAAGRTQTVPDGLRGGTYEGADVVTALLLYGTDTLYPLSPSRMLFTAGSAPDRDIAIPSAFVSSNHCRLERRLEDGLPVLQVLDQRSKNGTYFEGKREKSFSLRPGKMFVLGARTQCLLALNEKMRTNHPALTEILGYEDEHVIGGETPSPSALIVAAVNGAHLLITSEPNCGEDRLARIVHAISLFRERPLIELEQIPRDRARQEELVTREVARSTLVLRLGERSEPLGPTFGSMLFSAKNQVRVIALARSVDAANEALGKRYVRQMQDVWLRPLSNRPAAIHRLLDGMLERHGSLRVEHMTPDNQRALRVHGWPDNFASLQRAADWLPAVAHQGSLRKASRELDIPTATLHNWYTNIVGLSLPLISGTTAI